MYRKIWKKAANSVALLSFYTENKIKINSITAFKVNDYLITDSYINRISNYETVRISFVDRDGITVTAEKVIGKDELKKSMIKGENSLNSDFCVIKADYDEFENIPSLEFEEDSNAEIGAPIVSIGYQLNQDNLSIKRGVISSFYKAHRKQYLQFDASVKPGNAGSPLIDVESGKVIGVIGLKLAQVSQSHKKIKDIINNNIAILKNYQGRLNIDDVDPIQVLIANQNLIKYIAKDLYSMASMCLGYAVPANDVVHFFKKNIILENFKPSYNALVNI